MGSSAPICSGRAGQQAEAMGWRLGGGGESREGKAGGVSEDGTLSLQSQGHLARAGAPWLMSPSSAWPRECVRGARIQVVFQELPTEPAPHFLWGGMLRGCLHRDFSLWDLCFSP